MVPINPATQSGLYPSTPGGQTFDPYATSPIPSNGGYAPPAIPGNGYGNNTGVYGTNPGMPPAPPGASQSGALGTYPNSYPTYGQPGAIPSSAPSALFPGGGNPNAVGDFFSGTYNSVFGSATVANVYSTAPGTYPPPIASSGPPPNMNGVPPPGWNPQGAMFAPGTQPQFIRFFQGARFRDSYIFSQGNVNSMAINDTDLSLAVLFPNFLWSTQPLFLMPSFSLHQWSGPITDPPEVLADMPAIAYSAFLDAGWQSDPARILGADLGMRIGMFSDFNSNSSESLRIMGRGIAKLRVTPRSTLKVGVLYLDRNDIKLLPALGLLWEPNAQTKFDIFFPEPKLAHYLSTIGTTDTWWYLGGFYGGGNWTIQRADGSNDKVDINDIRVVLGVEWGLNDLIKAGRRFGFFEIGYVFNRELVYKVSPQDNLDLEDSFVIRAGIGY